jgi:hypothetical protein
MICGALRCRYTELVAIIKSASGAKIETEILLHRSSNIDKVLRRANQHTGTGGIISITIGLTELETGSSDCTLGFVGGWH